MTVTKLTDDQIYALEALQRVFGADKLYRDWTGLYIQPPQRSKSDYRFMRIPAGTCLDGLVGGLNNHPWSIEITPILLAHYADKSSKVYEKGETK